MSGAEVAIIIGCLVGAVIAAVWAARRELATPLAAIKSAIRSRRFAATVAALLVVGGYSATQWVGRASAANRNQWYRYKTPFALGCAAMTIGAGMAVFLVYPGAKK